MSSCPQCHQPNRCQAETGHCWCFELPRKALTAPPKQEDCCLCPDCLAQLPNAFSQTDE